MNMAEHYNLYYLFLEDKANSHLPPERKEAIQKNLENLIKKIKPP